MSVCRFYKATNRQSDRFVVFLIENYDNFVHLSVQYYGLLEETECDSCQNIKEKPARTQLHTKWTFCHRCHTFAKKNKQGETHTHTKRVKVSVLDL